MRNKELIEMTEILMEMPEEKYQECKREFLNTEFKSPMMKDFLRLLFVSIEKRRPELVEGGASNVSN